MQKPVPFRSRFPIPQKQEKLVAAGFSLRSLKAAATGHLSAHQISALLALIMSGLIFLLTEATAWAADSARREFIVRLRPGPPVCVLVYRKAGKKLKLAAPVLTYRHRGKMASVADIDGDGQLDLLVLVYKKTRYDKKLAWRPFVYTLHEGSWVPKWLGSRVGRPLMEAVLVNTSAGARLLTVERFAEGKTVLTLYHWRGFGFWGEWTSAPMPAARSLQVKDRDGDGRDEISVVEFGGARRWFECSDGKLVWIQE